MSTAPASAPSILFAVRAAPIALFGDDFHNKHIRKLVLLILASYANPDGSRCFPSLATLAGDCGLSERTVQRAISWLRKNTLLEIEYRAGKNQTSAYSIRIPEVTTPVCRDDAPVSPPRVTTPVCRGGDDTGMTRGDDTPVSPNLHYLHRPSLRARAKNRHSLTPAPPEGVTEPELPTPDLPPVPAKARANKPPASECELIFKAYPKRKAKAAALRAIAKALKKVPFTELLATVERYAAQVQRDGTEMRFIPHPATWFNAGSYDDDDLKPPPEYDIVEVSPEEWERGRGPHGVN